MQGQFAFSPIKPLQQRKDQGNIGSEFNLKIKGDKGFQCRELVRDPSPNIQRSPIKKEVLPGKNYGKKMWEYDWTLLIPETHK